MTKKNATKIAARARQAEHGGKYLSNLRTVGGGGGNNSLWLCDFCKKPIASGAGFVHAIDSETGRYPEVSTATARDLAVCRAGVPPLTRAQRLPCTSTPAPSARTIPQSKENR
jgi:hypothetical protein